MNQLTLFPEVCRRCSTEFMPADSDFYCDGCSVYLDKTHVTFTRPLTPQTLWDRIRYDFRKLGDAELVTVYKYVMFANALQRYWDYQFYHWPQRLRHPLSQWAGYDAIEEMRTLITERNLIRDAENFHIDYAAIKRWIQSRDNAATMQCNLHNLMD